MPASLDATGLTIPPLSETQGEISQDLLDTISDTLDVSEESYLGQVIGATSRQIRTAYELIQAAYAARDPDQAEGFALDGLCAILGISRNAATSSYVTCALVLDAGTYPAGSLVAHVAGDPAKRFKNRAEIVVASGPVYVLDEIFDAEEAGPIAVNAATLTVIAESVTGWVAITNTAGTSNTGGYLGTLAETDAALRLRRVQNLAKPGTGTVDAIRADLLAVEGVVSVSVIDNVTDSTDGNGLPPHSVAAVVRGGDSVAVATALLEAAPAGINTYGSTSEVVADAQGVAHTIRFSEATEIPLYCEIELTAIEGEYAGDDAVKAALVAEFGSMPTGKDVKAQRLILAALGVAGVVEATAVRLDDVDPPVAAANIPIPFHSYGNLEAGNIEVTSNLISGYP